MNDMKIKFGRKKGEWYAGVYAGRGGVNSLVRYRKGRFWHVLGVFTLENVAKARSRKM